MKFLILALAIVVCTSNVVVPNHTIQHNKAIEKQNTSTIKPHTNLVFKSQTLVQKKVVKKPTQGNKVNFAATKVKTTMKTGFGAKPIDPVYFKPVVNEKNAKISKDLKKSQHNVYRFRANQIQNKKEEENNAKISIEGNLKDNAEINTKKTLKSETHNIVKADHVSEEQVSDLPILGLMHTYNPTTHMMNKEKEEDPTQKAEVKKKQKVGVNSFERVQYVPKISEYGKDQLKMYRSPLSKDSFLVGRSLYNENGIIFNDTPGFYKESSKTGLTNVEVPHYIHSSEFQKLWEGEFPNKLKRVAYPGQPLPDEPFERF